MTTAMDSATERRTKDEFAILALIDGMSESHRVKSTAAFAAAYAPDAAIYNLAPPLVHHGVGVAGKQAWFDSWEGPIVIEPRDFKVTVDGDHAFAFGFMRMAGRKKGPEDQVSFWMRETLCLERAGDGWKIVHEHTSVPFYMDGSLRPAFDLRP